MRINTITYKDKVEGWEYQKIDFFDLTLLVGISGVGKTQILRSLMSLKKIAGGEALNGIAWEVSFSNEDLNYKWEGVYDSLPEENFFLKIFKDKKEEKPKILKERILLNEHEVARRDGDDIYFEGNKMPKLAFDESLINIFKEEDKIKKAFQGFKKIILRDHTEKEGNRLNLVDDSMLNQFSNLNEVINSDLNTIEKLYWTYKNDTNTFNEIKENFIDVFQQVEDVKVEPRDQLNVSDLAKAIPLVQIKEKGVPNWIDQGRISSGMFRTFLHISELYLLSEGTVVLIDEFENSLGVNCIDVLTENLIFENKKIQFIATSHHPYIINQIPHEYWKIVGRQGGKIITHDAKDFDLGESRHENFLKLINLKQYREGIQ